MLRCGRQVSVELRLDEASLSLSDGRERAYTSGRTMLFRDTVLLLDTMLLPDTVRPVDSKRAVDSTRPVGSPFEAKRPLEPSRSLEAMLFHGRITRTLSVRDHRDPQRSGLS